MEEMAERGEHLHVEVDLVGREYLAAVQSANRRLTAGAGVRGRDRGAFMWVVVRWAVLGLLGALIWKFASFNGRQLEDTLPWLGALAIGAVFLAVLIQRRRLYRRLLAGQSEKFSVTLEEHGLRVASERGESFFHWSALEAIESGKSGIHLHFKGFQVIWIPERCFSCSERYTAFLAALRAGSGLPDSALLPRVAVPLASGRLLKDLAANLLAGVKLLGFRREGVAQLRPSGEQFISLVLFSVLANLAFDVARIGGQGELNWPALPAHAYGAVLMLLAAWAAARAEEDAYDRVLPAALAMAALWLILEILLGSLEFLPGKLFGEYSSTGMLARLALMIWGALASIVALVRVLGLLPEFRLAAVLAVIYLLLLPSFLIGDQGHLWTRSYAGDEDAKIRRERWEKATREAVLYAQPRLLDEALARIRPGVPGVPELYFVGLAGYGEQDVFLREVQAVGRQFGERYQTGDHALLLINNPDSVLSQPMASVTALRQALKVIGKRMNPEDILFLFMTSHGSAQHRFDLSLWPYRFDDLTPKVLKELLDEAGIRYRVIVVSACYSGGFVRPLEGPDTLVMSAARADRNSHGCSHEAEWTFFGKAYFVDGLAQTSSFISAFDIACNKVAEREKAEGLEPSEPQMAVGAGIRLALMGFERRFAK